MTGTSSGGAAGVSASTEGRGHWGGFLVALASLFVSAGYVAGSALAGASLASVAWAVPLVGGCVVVAALLYVDAA